MKIGVLALQGAFREHIAALERLGAAAFEVRLPQQLQNLDGLVIPGGESTSILNLIQHYHFAEPLKKLVQSGLPVLGTCAGLIVLARSLTTNNAETLGLMDMEVKRNAFGRQVDSFETELAVPVLGNQPFRAVFIRAPVIEKAAPGVEVLSRLPDGSIVAARQGNLLVTAFHP
jgi:5'-phosphate synthase pdxT subunit